MAKHISIFSINVKKNKSSTRIEMFQIYLLMRHGMMAMCFGVRIGESERVYFVKRAVP